MDAVIWHASSVAIVRAASQGGGLIALDLSRVLAALRRKCNGPDSCRDRSGQREGSAQTSRNLSRSPTMNMLMRHDVLMNYPNPVEPSKVGSYPPRAGAGGGYVWDEVLEYRVWRSPAEGAEDVAQGSDYFHAYASYEEAAAAARELPGAEEPLALVLQREYIAEDEPGVYRHVKQERVTEWPVEFLSRPRRDARTIPDFVAADAPPNRLGILRGQAPRPN